MSLAKLALATAFMLLGYIAPAWSQIEPNQSLPRAAQKRAAEQAREQLQQKLTALKRSIQSTETEKNHAADALAKSEVAISKANRALVELNSEQAETQARLAALALRLEEEKQRLATRQKQLATIVRQQHMTNSEEPIPLLLSGENPAQIGRSLRYMDYIGRAQAKLIETIQSDLNAIQQNQAQLQVANAELNNIATESIAQKTQLENEQTQRAGLMKKLAGQLASQRAEAGSLQRDEGRLGSLVEQLSKLIAEQQKAEALAAQKRRQQAIAQAAAALRARQLQEKQRQSAQAKVELRRSESKKTTQNRASPGSAPVSSFEPDMAENNGIRGKTNIEADEQSAPKATLSSIFSTLKGQLKIPVKGEISNRFGSARGAGPTWKGWLISAPEGTPVHAVASGQVVFSDWLRGFGNLIIVDHGGQYLTIYGNNQAVLKHAGDQINTGDVIAAAGNTGGNEQSGLYFEMRYQGRAFDPAGWVTTR